MSFDIVIIIPIVQYKSSSYFFQKTSLQSRFTGGIDTLTETGCWPSRIDRPALGWAYRFTDWACWFDYV